MFQRRYSHLVDKSAGVRSDQTVVLATIGSAQKYPDALHRISYVDDKTNNRLTFLTNNFVLSALTIAEIYKCRWQVEFLVLEARASTSECQSCRSRFRGDRTRSGPLARRKPGVADGCHLS